MINDVIHNKIVELSNEFKKWQQMPLSLNEENSSLNERISRTLEEIIQNCDSASYKNKVKLLHLSQMMLNHFSEKSVFWILTIYKKVMGVPANVQVLPPSHEYHELFQKLLNFSNPGSTTAHRFTCVDLVKKAPEATSLDSQYKYAQLLVRLLSQHIHQE